MPGPRRDVVVASAGDVPELPPDVVEHVVRTVLDGEGSGAAHVSVAFLSSQRMRALNRRSFGRDRATDVIAFGMPHADRLVADLYVCPPAARHSARALDVPAGEELLRVLIHGTLHALGHDHPDGSDRTASHMWRRQERYVARLRAALP